MHNIREKLEELFKYQSFNTISPSKEQVLILELARELYITVTELEKLSLENVTLKANLKLQPAAHICFCDNAKKPADKQKDDRIIQDYD